MPHHIGRLGLAYPLLMAGLASFTVGGCGGSSPDAGKLLRQTFNGPHSVGSGNVSFTLTVSPAKTGPIMLSFGGPFQTVGQGKLPASSFILSVSAPGHSASVGL